MDLEDTGLVPLTSWLASLTPPRSIHTAKRWRAQGRLITRKIGHNIFVDVQATAARMRGEDQPQRRRLKG